MVPVFGRPLAGPKRSVDRATGPERRHQRYHPPVQLPTVISAACSEDLRNVPVKKEKKKKFVISIAER